MKTNNGANAKVIHRYTNIASLFHILQKRAITLLSPHSWKDRNDSFYIEKYKDRKKLASVLALCFSEADETFHHWKVFANGSDGVRITFKNAPLIETISSNKGVITGKIIYKQVKEVSNSRPPIEELPFIKRKPYKDEKEVRIIYTNDKEEFETKELDIDIGFIEKITINPWINKNLFIAVKSTIRSIDGCEGIKVFRTTLLENESWKRAAMSEPGDKL